MMSRCWIILGSANGLRTEDANAKDDSRFSFTSMLRILRWRMLVELQEQGEQEHHDEEQGARGRVLAGGSSTSCRSSCMRCVVGAAKGSFSRSRRDRR